MKLEKAVITAVSAQRDLPLQNLVDSDGVKKAALRILIEEASRTGIKEIAIVVRAGDGTRFQAALGDLPAKVEFIEHTNPRGLGDTLYSASGFVGDDMFLHFPADTIYVGRKGEESGIAHLAKVASTHNCAVTAVQRMRENMLPYFAVVGGEPFRSSDRSYQIKRVHDRPTPTLAENDLAVADLRAGFYLCILGTHVLTPKVMELLRESVESTTNSVDLVPVLSKLAGTGEYLAVEVASHRYKLDTKHGAAMAQLTLALAGSQREEMLATVAGFLAKVATRQPLSLNDSPLVMQYSDFFEKLRPTAGLVEREEFFDVLFDVLKVEISRADEPTIVSGASL